MKTTRLARRCATVIFLAAFVASVCGGAAGCWFTTGKEGYFCESESDCKDGLRCRTYVYRSQPRKQCRPPGKNAIVARSGYNTLFVYLTYVFWAVFPPALVGVVIVIRRARLKVLAELKAGHQSTASLNDHHPDDAV